MKSKSLKKNLELNKIKTSTSKSKPNKSKVIRHRILIVEDNPDMVKIYKKILSEKFDLTVAKNIKKAFEKLSTNNIDLIVLDIIMPEESGDVFLTKLRSKKEYDKLKVIVVSVLGDIYDQLSKISPGIICVTKPFDAMELLKIIKEVIKR